MAVLFSVNPYKQTSKFYKNLVRSAILAILNYILGHFGTGLLMVTNSSALVGCIPSVASN